MAIHEADLVTKIQLRLRDPSTATFSTANIHEAMNDALFDFAEYVPNVVVATVTTRDGTAFINIGALSDLLYGENVNSFESVEFPVDQNPQKLRSFSVQGSALHMDIDFLPGSAEDVRILTRTPHLATGSAAASLTLSPRLERLFIPYVAGIIAGDEAIDSIGGISIGGQNTSEQFEGRGFRVTDKIRNELSKMRKAQMNIEYPRDR